MFEIVYEDELHRQWSCGYLFNNFKEAKEYLIKKGFIEKNRLFYKENYGWTLRQKAYITPKRIYLCTGG